LNKLHKILLDTRYETRAGKCKLGNGAIKCEGFCEWWLLFCC